MDAKEFRETGHKVVDLLAEYFGHIDGMRVFPDAEPRAVRELFDEPLPSHGESPDAVLDPSWGRDLGED
jgi:tyrosine decarboxylase